MDKPRSTIVLTGATGFVGRYLVSYLAQCGFNLKLVCRQQPEPGLSADHQVFLCADLADASFDWSAVIAEGDIVLHLAGRAHQLQPQQAQDATAFYQDNVLATKAIAVGAKNNQAGYFVYLSTAKVNGDNSEQGLLSVDCIADNLDAYAASKLQAEGELKRILQDAIPTLILRPPLILGPGVKGNVARLSRWVRSGWPVPLGGINNKRHMISLVSLAYYIERAIMQRLTGCYLLADARPVSTAWMVKQLAAHHGKHQRVIAVPETVLRLCCRMLGCNGLWSRLGGSMELDIQPIQAALGMPPCGLEKALAIAIKHNK